MRYWISVHVDSEAARARVEEKVVSGEFRLWHSAEAALRDRPPGVWDRVLVVPAHLDHVVGADRGPLYALRLTWARAQHGIEILAEAGCRRALGHGYQEPACIPISAASAWAQKAVS